MKKVIPFLIAIVTLISCAKKEHLKFDDLESNFILNEKDSTLIDLINENELNTLIDPLEIGVSSQVNSTIRERRGKCTGRPRNCTKLSFIFEIEYNAFKSDIEDAISNETVSAFFELTENWIGRLPLIPNGELHQKLVDKEASIEILDMEAHGGLQVNGMITVFREVSGDIIIAIPVASM